MPLLTFCSGMSSTATVVASEPVPDVVGIARCGRNGAGGSRPAPPAAPGPNLIGVASIVKTVSCCGVIAPPNTDRAASGRRLQGRYAAGRRGPIVRRDDPHTDVAGHGEHAPARASPAARPPP